MKKLNPIVLWLFVPATILTTLLAIYFSKDQFREKSKSDTLRIAPSTVYSKGPNSHLANVMAKASYANWQNQQAYLNGNGNHLQERGPSHEVVGQERLCLIQMTLLTKKYGLVV